MLRTFLSIFLLSSLVAGYDVPACAQVGFGVVQTPVTTGGSLTVGSVITRGGTHARMGISASFSQVIDVHTFSPVQGYPGLVPVGPVGFGSGVAGGRFGQMANNNMAASVKPKPTVDQFVAAVKKFDRNKDSQLDSTELSKVASAVIAELSRTPGYNIQRLVGRPRASGGTVVAPPTAGEVQRAFIAQCLKYDRDGDESLDERETKRMATDLVRSLLKTQ